MFTQNNVQGNEVPKTTLSGVEPVRTFTFWCVVQLGTTEPAIATAKSTENLCILHDTLINLINTVASPDRINIAIYMDHTVHPAGRYSPTRHPSLPSHFIDKVFIFCFQHEVILVDVNQLVNQCQ